MKLSFKKEKMESGLSSIDYPYPNTNIKINGKVVGHISGPNWRSKDPFWRAYIAIVKGDDDNDANPNCDWMWKLLQPMFADEISAREYIKTHKEDIFKLDLHYFDS